MNFFTKYATGFGLKQPIGFHTYWTAPKGSREFSKWELLMLIAGPTFWRQQCGGSQFWLLTDALGWAQFNKLGLLGLYDNVELLGIPEWIRPAKYWWTYGKLIAYKRVPVPWVSVDWDAYVTKPFWLGSFADYIALNPEPVNWECYRRIGRSFLLNYFSKLLNLESAVPVNTGVLGMFNTVLRDRYCAEALHTIERAVLSGYKCYPMRNYEKEDASETTYFAETISAEQWLLPLIAQQGNFTSKVLALEAKPFTTGPGIFHVWTGKEQLIKDPKMRASFEDRLEESLRQIGCRRCSYVLRELFDD